MEINMKKSQPLKKISLESLSKQLADACSNPVVIALVTLVLGSSASSVQAGERESLEQLRATTTNLVNLLVQEGVLSKDKADALLKQAAQDAEKAKQKDAIAAPATTAESVDAEIDKKMVRVQYVPEIVKNEMKEDIKNEVMATLNYKKGERLGIPEWIDRFTWEGDMRLRYERQLFSSSNPSRLDFNAANNLNGSGFALANTTEDRNRTRLRLRFGFNAQINDWITGGVRLTTGGLNDSLSGNQTLETATSKYTVGLDRAFIKADVKPWLVVKGGRFENPFMSTDLVWDNDLPFDGAAAKFDYKVSNRLTTFGTIGAFPLDEIQGSDVELADSKWMIGAQAGVKWKSSDSSTAKLGLALYDFKNVEGKPNPTNLESFNSTAPVFRTKGNSFFDINALNNFGVLDPRFALASKFRELNLIGEVDIASFSPVHVILTGDYVRNIGFDKNEIARRTGLSGNFIPKEETDGYQLRVAVGMPDVHKKKDWQTFISYKYLEADAVLDSYTDSDFFQRGTNTKGFILGGSYGIDKNTWLQARWFSADEINPRNSLNPLSIDVFQLDLNTRF
jgi:Putative porin